MVKSKAHPDRKLGVLGLTTFYISSIVGVGILVVPGIAYRIAGPASLLSWLALIVISFPLAYLFSRMSMNYPNNGGIVYFIRIRFGERLGRSAGTLLTLTMIVGNPIMGIASARYLLHMFGLPNETALVLLTGFGFMMLSILFNLLHIQLGSQIQFIMLVLLLSGLVTVVVLAVPHYRAEAFVPFAPNGWSAIGGAMVVCLYSFLGWENVSTIAEEVRDPVRTYKWAAAISVVIVGVLYLAIAASIIFTIPHGGSEAQELAIAQMLVLISTPQGALLGSAAAIAMMVLCTNAWVLSASRFVQALGRSGDLPRLLGKTTRTKAPYYALLFLLVSYAFVLIVLYVTNGNEEQLMLFANGSFILVYLLAFLASLKHFGGRYANGFALVSILFCLVSLYFIGAIALLPLAFLFIQFLFQRRRSYHAGQSI